MHNGSHTLAPPIGNDQQFQAILRELRDLRTHLDELGNLVRGRTKSHLTVTEVAELTGRSAYTVRRWISDGRIIAIKLQGTGPKGRLMIARDELAK